MKKAVLTVLALALCVSLCACAAGSKPDATTGAEETTADEIADGGFAGLANPMVEYSSLSEINEIAGVKLTGPEVMGKTDEKFYVIDGEIAQYDFMLNGLQYSIRGSQINDCDISGVYIDAKLAFEGEENAEFSMAGDETCKVCRFLAGGAQYVVSVTDNGTMDEAVFDSDCREIKTVIEENAK